MAFSAPVQILTTHIEARDLFLIMVNYKHVCFFPKNKLSIPGSSVRTTLATTTTTKKPTNPPSYSNIFDRSQLKPKTGFTSSTKVNTQNVAKMTKSKNIFSGLLSQNDSKDKNDEEDDEKTENSRGSGAVVNSFFGRKKRSTDGQQRFGSLFTPSLANGLYSPFGNPGQNLYRPVNNLYTGSPGLYTASNTFSTLRNPFASTINSNQQCPAILQGLKLIIDYY